MLRKVLLGLVVISGLCGTEARAEKWSFEQLMGAASVSYPSVLSREAAREAASADVKNAEWQRYPAPSIENTTDRQGNNNVVLRLQQVLWAGGAITGQIDSARSLRDASDKAIREAQFDVVSRVIDAYVDAVRQQARREVSRKNLKQHETLDESIKRRVAAEVSPEVDHRLSLSRLSQAVNDLSTIDQGLARSLNALSQLSGKDVTEAVPFDPASLRLPVSLDQALRQAIAASPALSRLGYEEAAAESQIQVKKSALWPTLAVRYEKSFNNNAQIYGATSDNRVMAVISAQPGAGLSSLSGVASAVARKNAAAQERQAALRDLQRIITDAWNDREAARSQLGYAASAQSSAEDVAESYKRQYIIGRKAWLDVLNAVREATQSELFVEDARAQFAVATLRIALLTDNLNLEVKK
jgi:outer membrane protein, adhesin transport system